VSGRHRAWWGGAVAALAALTLGAPASAVASHIYVVPAGSLTFAHLDGTNGYRIHFSENERHQRRHFKLTVIGHHATISYQVPTGRTAAGVVADLGRRGRFGLRFVPVGKVRSLGLGRRCEKHEGRWQDGYLVGTARFRGEGDFTEVRIRRIPALSESWPRFRCRYGKSGLGRYGARRQVDVRAQRRGLEFDAALLNRHAAPPGRRVTLRAWSGGQAGRMWISREVKVSAAEPAFTFPGGPKLPEEVTVTPPPPFIGSATFARTPESTFTWTGDLAVDFPGLEPIHLAGPAFSVSVCGLEACVRQDPAPR
jgi:hypothetical protein